MHEGFPQLEALCTVTQRIALATLVHTVGTSPRKEGEKMSVGEGGAILGAVTIGGCVDAHVIEQAEAVLATQVPRLITLPLGDEEAWELGLSCAGTIEVFIEPHGPSPSPTLDLYTALRSHLGQGAAGVVLTCLDGATLGAKCVLLDNGRTLGSLGDPALDQLVSPMALAHLAQGLSRTVSIRLPHQIVRIFIEVYTPPATMIIVGASQVAMALVPMARLVGFHTVVVDSRPRFATPERFPTTHRLLVGIPSELVKTLPLSATTAVVLVAHDYKYDLPILRHVLSTPVGYIGVLGSRRRGLGLAQFLREEGLAEEALERIRVPIGLDLGGRSAPEIALAIVAEVVASRYGGSALRLQPRRQVVA